MCQVGLWLRWKLGLALSVWFWEPSSPSALSLLLPALNSSLVWLVTLARSTAEHSYPDGDPSTPTRPTAAQGAELCGA